MLKKILTIGLLTGVTLSSTLAWSQQLPELTAIHLVRGTGDLTAAMPRFVTAFVEKQLPA